MKYDHSEKAVRLFAEGLNCAQAIFTAFADVTGMAEELAKRLSSSFGGDCFIHLPMYRSYSDSTSIQNTRSCVNVFSEGTICSRIVLRISFGMTTLPRSSILRTIPVGGIVRRMQEN